MRKIRFGWRILQNKIITLAKGSTLLTLEVLPSEISDHFKLHESTLNVRWRISTNVDQGFRLENRRHLIPILVTTRRLLLFWGISSFSKFAIKTDSQYFVGVVLFSTRADLAFGTSDGSLRDMCIAVVILLYFRHSLRICYPFIPADPSLLMLFLNILVGAKFLYRRQTLFFI